MTHRSMTNRILSIWNFADYSAVICYVCHKPMLGKLHCNILYVSSYWKDQFTVWEPGISAILAPCEVINYQGCCKICFVWSISFDPISPLHIIFLFVILPKFHLHFVYDPFIFTCLSHRNLHFITQATVGLNNTVFFKTFYSLSLTDCILLAIYIFFPNNFPSKYFK
jgi:hypothetical protein